MIDANSLKERLHYDPETGLFTWLKKTGSQAAGACAGYLRSGGEYVVIGIRRKTYLAHRLAYLYMTGNWPREDLDHANGNRQDNRWENLRACSRAENMQNLRPVQKNVGQFRAHNGRYRARIKSNGRAYNLGYFDTPEKASAAYRKAKASLHEFNPGIRE